MRTGKEVKTKKKGIRVIGLILASVTVLSIMIQTDWVSADEVTLETEESVVSEADDASGANDLLTEENDILVSDEDTVPPGDSEMEQPADPEETEEVDGVLTQEGDGIQPLGTPAGVIGINLYSGSDPDISSYIGSYTSWANLVSAINGQNQGEYAIDLYGVDLTSTANWGTAFNSNATTGNNQYYLNFYSTTGNTFTLPSNSIIGAHVEFHAGLTLGTPNSSAYGSIPLASRAASTTGLAGDAITANNSIMANGWRFVVNKGVSVTGTANLYAGTLSASGGASFNNGKTVIADGGGMNSGYLEVNAGRWRYIGACAVNGGVTMSGAYRIFVGNDDDPAKPVEVDAVFGTNYGYIAGTTPGIDIPTEYIEVTGNTVVKYGVACTINGNTVYNSGVTSVQKVVIGGNATILKSWGNVDATDEASLSDSNKNSYIRTSVTAGAVGQGYGHYTGNTNIVNVIVEIRDNAWIAGDVVGTGSNMYWNVHSNSKGIHISITDYAQVGGNVVYGGSSSASSLKPNDSVLDPFFTMEVIGAGDAGDVKIGGHLLATNGEDYYSSASNASSWAVVTRVKNATVNGSVFGYGNLANEYNNRGIDIKNAEIDIDNAVIGGGVYGVTVGSNAATSGSCDAISITIHNSTVGHVVPLFVFSDTSSISNASGYRVGGSNVNITGSVVTGRTVMWRTGSQGGAYNNLPTYSFVTTADGTGTKTKNLKALAAISVGAGGGRNISFNTDGYAGIVLAANRPEISMTTSMLAGASSGSGMDLANAQISLTSSSGNHNFSITDTDFTRTNGNPTIVIMDRGDGTLGTSAAVSIDNCHATASGRKLDVAVFGTLTGSVTNTKIGKMTMNLKNTNDLANVGFAQSVSSANSYYINTQATIEMDNVVVDNLFGKGGGNNERLRSAASDTLRVQFQFKNNNTIKVVQANGADVVFCEDSISYLSDFFNNTGSTVFDKEYVETESGARVYLGNSGASATRTTLGGTKVLRVFGSISGTAGELYIYKDTGSSAGDNATYPIYVAEGGSILEKGMNLGEWSSSDGSIATADKDTVLNASSGKNKQYTITEPGTSKTQTDIQAEHDILIAFGTTANAVTGRINDQPLRPWPLIAYSDANSGAAAEQYGWLILGKPRYQVIYQGSGIQEDNENISIEGKIGTESRVVRQGVGTSDDYLYLLNNDNSGKPYTIEDYEPTATQDSYYTFVYWRLYGSTEGSLEGVSDAGILIPENWSIVANEGVENSSGENKWVINDSFTLKTLLDSSILSRQNSKVLTLVPVYKANYVCKIGNQGYLELSDAFDAISAGTATAESNGSYQIKMLVEEYMISEMYAIMEEWDITITTADESDTTLPYRGTAGTKCTLLRSSEGSGYSGKFFMSKGTLTLTDIVLDGNSNAVSGNIDTFIELGGDARLNLLSGSILQNNRTNNGITSSAVTGAATSTIYLNGTVIKNNEARTNAAGGGAIMSGKVILEGKVVVTDNYRSYNDGTQTNSNICLDANGKVYVNDTLSPGSAVGIRVQDVDHVDEYEFAETVSAICASSSYQYFSDDFDDSMEITVSTNPNNIMFKGSTPFSFTKVKAEDTSEILTGAEFKLYKFICEDSSHDHNDTTSLVTEDNIGTGNCWELTATKESDTSGLVDFEDLEEGIYMLVETRTVSGYQLPSGQWKLTVTPTGMNKIIIQAHGAQDDLPPAFMTATDSEGTVTYKLPNIRQLSLPFSGMPGVRILQILGTALALLTILLYILRKRSNDRRRFILLKDELTN